MVPLLHQGMQQTENFPFSTVTIKQIVTTSLLCLGTRPRTRTRTYAKLCHQPPATSRIRLQPHLLPFFFYIQQSVCIPFILFSNSVGRSVGWRWVGHEIRFRAFLLTLMIIIKNLIRFHRLASEKWNNLDALVHGEWFFEELGRCRNTHHPSYAG